MKRPEINDSTAELFFKYYYQDRGMLKWQGYYLSDHTSALNHQAEEKAHTIHRQVAPEMTSIEIDEIINHAIKKNTLISIQSNIKDDNGVFPPPISGHIRGYEDSRLFLDSGESIELVDIRSIVQN